MKCPKCDAENPDDAEFCSLCYARFQVQLRSRDVDEAAQLMSERNHGSKLCCPSCGDLSPLDTQFCLRCGFVFENLEAIMVTAEEIEEIVREREELKAGDHEEILSVPMEITVESDGAEAIRNLEDMLAKGEKARVHVRGRDAVTYAMKIIALVSEELRGKGREIKLIVRLTTEGSITYLDDVELEIILENA
jgi:ribosomal protein L40E